MNQRVQSETRPSFIMKALNQTRLTNDDINTIKQPNEFLRKDMRDDGDDKFSDNTMRSVFNQY